MTPTLLLRRLLAFFRDLFSQRDRSLDSNNDTRRADRELSAESLEPRILYSAAPAPAETPAAEEAPAAEPTPTPAPAAAAPEAAPAAPATEAPPEVTGETDIAPSQGVELVDAESLDTSLDQQALETIAAAAKQRWVDAGISAEQIEALDSATYTIADLDANQLGKVNGTIITIDDDAAGSGAWFVDQTPDLNEEYLGGVASGAAAGSYDLLSVVLHEQGHVLGIDDLPGSGGDVMNQVLGTSARRLPDAAQADGAVPGAVEGEHFVVTPPGLNGQPLDPSRDPVPTGGTGVFSDSSQSLGSSWSYGLSLGDLDGDGDLDAFVANNNSFGQSNKVWINNGSGTFTDSGQSLGGSNSKGVSLGDVDGDGDLDAFVANSGENNKVWLNDGSGTFTDSSQSLGYSDSRGVSLGDVDGDGDLDAFVANSFGQANKVWINDGSGNFTDSSQGLGSSNGGDVSLGDLDGDGDLDAFVANTNSQANKVWLNDGSGTFTATSQSLGSSWSNRVSLGDVDGDGDLDAFVANSYGQANKVWLNDGSGSFSDSGLSLGSSRSQSVSLGDVDGDGDLDAFIANNNYEANKVWINDGSGNFTDSSQTLGASNSSGVSLGDLDGDGDLDAFVATAYSSAGPLNEVWLNNTPVDLSITKTSGATSVVQGDTITYTVTVSADATTAVTGATIADTFPDTLSDVDLTNITLNGSATTSATTGLLGSNAFSETVNLPAGSSIVYTFTATVYGSNANNQPVSALLTNDATVTVPGGFADSDETDNTAHDSEVIVLAVTAGTGDFADSGQNLGSQINSYNVGLGDLNGDGDLDAFVVNSGPANQVWLNDGSGSFTTTSQSFGNSASLSVSLGDVDGDGDLDAFVANNNQGNTVWLNDGSGTFTDSSQSLGSSFSRSVSLGDVDGDGDLDAFVANKDQSNKVWINDGSGSFTDSSQGLGASASRGVSLGDVDNDGDLDAFVVNINQGNKVWLNDGGGAFSDSGQSLGASPGTGVSLGDIDGDGDLDAFVTNYGANKVWLNNGSGAFTDSGQNLGGSASSSNVSLGDVDNDGDLDAFVANRATGNKVWLNDGSGAFTDSSQNLGSLLSSGVNLGDVDGDGDLDAFVTNSGTQADKVWINQNPAPEITIEFDDTNDEIVDGETATSGITVEGTDFGSVDIATGMVTRTFLIRNDGTASLTLINTGGLAGPINTVTLSGAGASHFEVTQQPVSGILSLVLAPTQTATFDITYDPTAVGSHTATVNVMNSDGDENPYNFDIIGVGTIADTTPPAITTPADITVNTMASGPVVDQAHPANAGFGFGGGFITGIQGVTSGISGALTGFELISNGFSGATIDVEVFINLGAPIQGDAHDFSTTVTLTDATAGLPFFVDTSSAGITLNAGEQFSIGVRPLGAMTLGADPAAGYAGGDFYIDGSLTTSDLGFQTFIDPGVAGAVVTYSIPTAIDDIDGPVSVNLESGLASGSFFPVGTTTITYSAEDAAGNSTTESFTVTVVYPAPEITVEFDDTNDEIADGQTATSGVTGEGTDFGPVDTASGMVTRTFLIRNDGTADLTLSGMPNVVITGDAGGHFTAGNFTGGGPVLTTGETRTFDVTFDPTADGVHTATVTIDNDDSDEALYDFAITGTGTTSAPPATEETGISISGGDLVITDVLGGDTDDDLTISTTANTLTIVDNNGNGIDLGAVTGTGDGTDTVTIDYSAFAGGIVWDSLGGNDILRVDFDSGDFSRTITFNGGAQSFAGDQLFLEGSGTFADTTYDFVNENDGSIDITGNATISYTGLEPITSTLNATNVTLNYSAVGETITTTASGASTKVDSTAGEEVTFTNPTTLLTINAGDGDDTINVNGLGTGFAAGLAVSGQGGSADLIKYGADGVSLGAGNGATFTAERVEFTFGDLTTSDGDIIVSGTGGSGGNFKGVRILGSTLATDSGNIDIDGQGGDSGTGNLGVEIISNSSLTTGLGGGSIDIDGTGGGTGVANHGVSILVNSSLSVGASGNINIDGTSSTAGTLINHGVSLSIGSSATVVDGNLTIVGTGSGSSGSNNGIDAVGTTLTASLTGSVSLTGSSNGNGLNNRGISLTNSAVNTGTPTSTGSITLNGTGSFSGLSNNDGIRLINTDLTTHALGSIDIDGLGGGTGTGILNNGVVFMVGSTVTAGGNSVVTIDGTGGSGTLFNRGIYSTGGNTITSLNGNITVQGTGTGSVSFNRGIDFASTTVTSTGIGHVTISGSGSTTSSGLFNSGVSMIGSTVSSGSAGLTITGVGGTGSSFNEGLRLQSSSVTSIGATNLSGTANGATTGLGNTGVYIFLNSTVNGNLASSITGIGGGGTGTNHGVLMNVGITSNIGLGSITGTAGPGGSSDDLSGNFFP